MDCFLWRCLLRGQKYHINVTPVSWIWEATCPNFNKHLRRDEVLLFYLLYTAPSLDGWGSDTKIHQRSTFYDAQIYCAHVYRGLTVITSQEEHQSIREVAGNDGNVWIGMHRSRRNSSVWLWSDGEQYSYFLCKPGQPNNKNQTQECVLSEPDGWKDCYCSNTRPFYCDRFIILVEEKTTWAASWLLQDSLQGHGLSRLWESTRAGWTEGHAEPNGQYVDWDALPEWKLVRGEQKSARELGLDALVPCFILPLWTS